MKPVSNSRTPLILHVLYSFSVGGLENGVANLLNRLPRSRWRHGIVALSDVSEEFRKRVQRDDVMYFAMHKAPGHLLRLYPRLFSLFRAHRPAIIHTRNLAALEAQVPAWAAGTGVRIHGEHGWDVHDIDGTNPRYQLVRRIYRPFVHHYVALSQQIERYLHRSVGMPLTRVSQIYNGVDTKRFRPSEGESQAPVGFPFGAPGLWVVGTVGRMQAVKDQLTLAAAFVQAVKGDTDVARAMRLIIVGDGPTRAAVEKVLDDGGVRHLAWLAGERTDIPDLMRAMNVFVLPSLSEGISNTVLEAMACGLPVVATRVGGNAELVEGGVSGELMRPGDTTELRDLMVGYFRDPQRARRHGQAGRLRAERQFSLDRMAAEYDRLYLRLLQRRGVPNVDLNLV